MQSTSKAMTYSKLDAMLASPSKPMPAQRQQHQMLHIWQAMAAIKMDAQPSKEDWRLLSDAINLSETLVAMGHMADDGVLEAAVKAMAHAAKRHMQGQPIRLSGEGLQAVAAVVFSYDEATRQLPERTMIVCHRATEKRLQGILQGKTHAHDVCVTSI